MLPKSPAADDLEQVYELNSLFLHLLRTRVENGGDLLGLPQDVVGLLQQIPSSLIDSFAEFPKALFRVRLGAASTGEAVLVPDDADAMMKQAVQITLLSDIRNTCRKSAYLARAFFDLSSETIQRLRGTPASALPALAQRTEVDCAFENRPWLWRALLMANDVESRRRLFLVAFQPVTGANASSGRNPHERAGNSPL